MKTPSKKVDKRFQREPRATSRSLKDLISRETKRREKTKQRHEKWKLERKKAKGREINRAKKPI